MGLEGPTGPQGYPGCNGTKVLSNIGQINIILYSVTGMYLLSQPEFQRIEKKNENLQYVTIMVGNCCYRETLVTLVCLVCLVHKVTLVCLGWADRRETPEWS